MGIINTLRNIFKPTSKPVKYNLDQFPELEGLSELRRGMSSYTEWMLGQYAAEMRRRFEYYEVNQVVVDPSAIK
jgi:hypothetical protein